MSTLTDRFLSPAGGRDAAAPAWLTGGRVLTLLEVAAGAAACIVFLSFAVVAAGHLSDRYHLNFATGVYAALAARLNDGVLYPPLYDGSHYGGTRYMPLSFVLHAGLARCTGEYVLSGKLLALALAVVLCVQLYRVLRGFSCGRGVALGLVALGVVTQSGFLAGTSIRGDLLSVVLQLGALGLVRGGASTPRAAAAGALCTLALLAKFTAAWAPAAIVVAYLLNNRRAGAVFLTAWLGTLAAALACLYLGSSGRMLESFRAAAVENVHVVSVLRSPVALLARLGRAGAAEAFLVPVAGLECVLALRQRRFTIYHGSLLLSLPILLVIFTDLGADFNHLLDLVVLAVPLAGSLWASLPSADRASAGPRAGMAVALCWVLFMCWTATLGNPVRDVVSAWRGHEMTRFPAKPLAGVVTDDASVLSEDPWVSVTRRQPPTVLDPYVLACLTRMRPELTNELVRRIEAGVFDRIVLRMHGGEIDPREEGEWEDRTLGRPVIDAVRAHYQTAAQTQGFIVYAPRRPAAPAGTAHAPN